MMRSPSRRDKAILERSGSVSMSEPLPLDTQRTGIGRGPGYARLSNLLPSTQLYHQQQQLHQMPLPSPTRPSNSLDPLTVNGQSLPEMLLREGFSDVWQKSGLAQGLRQTWQSYQAAAAVTGGSEGSAERPCFPAPNTKAAEELISEVLRDSEFYQNAGNAH